MKNYISTIILFLLVCFQQSSFGQSKIKDGSVTGSSSLPDANAIMELESSSKGFLLPRVALSATDVATPLTMHIAGMTVYNTATAGTTPLNVTPGYYYNDGTQWVRLGSGEPWYNKSTQAAATGNTDTIYTMGRVGVGTGNPQSALHVSGSSTVTPVGNTGYNIVSPTIRIDGLNAVNNDVHPAVDSGLSVKPVFVTAGGELVTGKFTQVLAGSPYNLVDDIPAPVAVSSSNGASVTEVVAMRSFTLGQASKVTLSYNVSVSEVASGSGQPITDNRIRLLRNYIRFTSVPTSSLIPLNKPEATSVTSYTNGGGTTAVGGYFYNSEILEVILVPGAYVVELVGDVYGGTASISANFGEGDRDHFAITAEPL